MFVSIEYDGVRFGVDTDDPIDISIPMKFNGDQPNAYGVEKARSTPCEAGELIGDTRQGGSCNFEQYTLIPHCNGTHTESIGHVTKERISIRDSLQDVFLPACLISVSPELVGESKETYTPNPNEKDHIITAKGIAEKISERKSSHCKALIIRSLPNSIEKLVATYDSDSVPPFFSSEAMDLISELGVKHLLVDLPSIDRIFDEGMLSNHRSFWNVENGKFETNDESRVGSTVTELIYVPDKVADGNYLLNIQIAAFDSDASPSRPVLFRLRETAN